MSGPETRHLVLVGLMGAGKTTVGQCCADLLGRTFLDTDELVVAAAGIPFDDIWAAEGEQGFRESGWRWPTRSRHPSSW